MAKEIIEIANSTSKKPIAQNKKRDKGLVDLNKSKISIAIYMALTVEDKSDFFIGGEAIAQYVTVKNINIYYKLKN